MPIQTRPVFAHFLPFFVPPAGTSFLQASQSSGGWPWHLGLPGGESWLKPRVLSGLVSPFILKRVPVWRLNYIIMLSMNREQKHKCTKARSSLPAIYTMTSNYQANHSMTLHTSFQLIFTAPHEGALGTWILASKEINQVKWLDQGHPTMRNRTGFKHPSEWLQLLLQRGHAWLLRPCGHPTHQFLTALRNRTLPRTSGSFNTKGTLSIFIFFILHLKVESISAAVYIIQLLFL